MENNCIVIIDPQKDFTHAGGNYAKRHPGILQITNAKQNIHELLQSIDQSLFLIITSNYSDNQFGENLSMCVSGTEGHQIDINIDDSYIIISKSGHSCFSSKAFISFLQKHKITHLILCGFLAEYCVKATTIDALSFGYNVSLLTDCIGTGDDVQHRKQQMLEELSSKGAKLIDHQELIDRLTA